MAFLLTHLLRGATAFINDDIDLVTFLLTHLLRGATSMNFRTAAVRKISTHAPLARCNKAWEWYRYWIGYFYSRTSCEVQRDSPMLLIQSFGFLLTHLLRGATNFKLPDRPGYIISTHAPLARCNGYEGDNRHVPDYISTHAPLARCNSYILCNLTIAPLYKVDRLKLIV